MKQTLSLALAGLMCASAAQAFEVTGGSLTLGYSSFFGSSDATDVSKLSFGNSMEFALTPEIAIQGDFSYTKLDATGIDSSNFGLHGIYHLTPDTALGAYVGRDRVEGRNLNYFGVEVAHQFGMIGTEAFVSIGKDGGAEGTVIGLKGDYALNDAASIGARFDHINVSGADANKFAVTGEVAALPGLNLTGEIGRAKLEGFGSEPYLGLGVKVNFGEKRGTTFDNRSIIDLLPGG